MSRIAWSWSRLNTFEKCGLQCYWKNFAPKDQRCPFVETDFFLRGKKIHAFMESAIVGAGLSKELAHMTPMVEAIRAEKKAGAIVNVEQELAFDEDYNSVSWFASNVWLRIIQDVDIANGTKMRIIDWKTGKNYGASDQLKLSACVGFATRPEVQEIKTSYVWIDQKEITSKVFHRAQFEEMDTEFRERSEMIQIANDSGEWRSNPSNFNCKYCPCTVAQCKHKERYV